MVSHCIVVSLMGGYVLLRSVFARLDSSIHSHPSIYFSNVEVFHVNDSTLIEYTRHFTSQTVYRSVIIGYNSISVRLYRFEDAYLMNCLFRIASSKHVCPHQEAEWFLPWCCPQNELIPGDDRYVFI